MKSMYKLLASALIVTLVMVYGCSDRGFNAAPDYVNDSGILEKDHVFYEEFKVQIRNQYQQLFMAAYIPKVQAWTIPPEYEPPERMPVLILLPPHGGDEYYYFNHGLAQIANRLIEDGTIDPMMIVIPSNDKVFGGYWWSGGYWAPDTSYSGSGKYDDLVGGSLVDYLYDTMFTAWADTGAGFLGIGGYGTGAYGAFRAAMLHPDRFGSVSGIDGPMDFDGGTYGTGLVSLFPQVLDEQGLLGDPAFAQEFDSLGEHRLSRLFIGGAEAFSPHDTLLVPVVQPVTREITCPIIDTVVDTISLSPFDTDTTIIQRRFQISDSTTLVDGIIGEGASNGFEQHFHLPFDGNGNTYAPIWSFWMRNNLDSLYLNEGGNVALSNVPVWLAYSTDNDPVGFNLQTHNWADFLAGQGANVSVMPYSGYEGTPAIGDRFLNALISDMLIFHDKEFKKAKAAAPSK